ncbi:MAG: FAD-dependent oxidoreductase [Deferribacteraceae bacterium]|jgi:succinate dehydrogenase/fumarate reductase flavoprotein subunit|nr:FAD-dependent oxidoreductase [Deferribacteraceae bacterium]
MDTENNHLAETEEASVAEISRRDFFKTTAAVAGVAAAATLAPNLATEAAAQAADRSNCQPYPWDLPAAAIPEANIKKTVKVDVLVIGCGITGTIAALSAKEQGAGEVQIIEKNRVHAARGGHITGFDTDVQRGLKIEQPNYRQIIREWVRWAQGRVNEDLLWLFARTSGHAFNWTANLLKPKGITAGLWNQYYKGPDYTEYPVTHMFEDTKTGIRGNEAAVKALVEICQERGITVNFNTPSVKLERAAKNGRVTSVVAGRGSNLTRFVVSKGVIIASGDYASDRAMTDRWCPIVRLADAQIYFPNKCNTGDLHKQAFQIGGVMQKTEPHAAVIHLEAGATSYGFLHVNALGKRFKNEDVNTQSKSCSKLFEPKGGVAWTIYDADGLKQVKEQLDMGVSGGLFYGQMSRLNNEPYDLKEEEALLKANIEQGKVVTANTLDELAKKMDVPAAELKKTVARYNELAKMGDDVDYGKRKELLRQIVKAPFYAGKLAATVLSMSGGLHTNPRLQVLDKDDQPIEGLYVAGSAAGDFFAADYPTICAGIGHGRCVTMGYLAGFMVTGKYNLPGVRQIDI